MARIGGAGRFFRGLGAGAAASIIVGMTLMLKNALGLFADTDVIAMLAELAGSRYRIDGWVALFVFGSLLGIGFAYAKRGFEGSMVRRALLFSLSAWAAVQLFVLITAASGRMGLANELALAVVLLGAHVVYGAALGSVYSLLQHLTPAPRKRRYVTLDTAHWGTRTDS